LIATKIDRAVMDRFGQNPFGGQLCLYLLDKLTALPRLPNWILGDG